MRLALALVLLFGLAACDTDTERALVGAAIGASVAKATKNDVAVGAAVGAAGGALCDNAGVCR